MAISRRIRGARTPIPAGKIVGRLPATGTGDAQIVDPTQLGRALVSNGVAVPPGSPAPSPAIADGRIESNISGATAAPTGNTITATWDHSISSTAGGIFYRGTSVWKVDASNFYWDDASHRLGIGTNSLTASFLQVGAAVASLTATAQSLVFNSDTLLLDRNNPFALEMIADYGGLDPPTSHTGFTVWTVPAGSITAGSATAADFEVWINAGSAQNITASTPVIGEYIQLHNLSSRTIGQFLGLQIATPENSGGGAITTAYGLYISAQTAASTNYAIYTFGGTVHFGDNAQVNGYVELEGATSGYVRLKAPATAGSNTITLPAGTTDFSATGPGAVYQASAGAAFSVGALPVADGGTGQTSYTDGQLLIGNTGTGGLTKATLTAGSGITITNGSGSITVAASGSSGTVTSIVAGTGLSGGTITTTGTISISNTGVTSGTYQPASITVNAQGQLTAASSSRTLIAKTASYNVATSESGSTYTNTGAGADIVATMPSWASGLVYTWVITAAHKVTVTFAASNVCYDGDTVTTAAGTVATNVVGRTITIMASDVSNTWMAIAGSGGWDLST